MPIEETFAACVLWPKVHQVMCVGLNVKHGPDQTQTNIVLPEKLALVNVVRMKENE